VTVVTHERELLFDDPVFHGVAETMWQRIPRHFPHVELDEWVVMPNHIHGIIVITDVGATHSTNGASTAEAGSQYVTPCSAKQATGNASPLPTSPIPPTGPPSGSLGAIVGNFKSVTVRRINRVRKTPGVRVWQRNYYEHIIRNERDLNGICLGRGSGESGPSDQIRRGATHSVNVASASEASCQDVKPRSARQASGNASPLLPCGRVR
jgi:REP element-mobilizing transposase RayT